MLTTVQRDMVRPGLIVARELAFISFLPKAIQCTEMEKKQDLLLVTSVLQHAF